MKKIIVTESQCKKVYTQLMNELLAKNNLLSEAQLNGNHARELLKTRSKEFLNKIVDKFLEEDPSLTEDRICYYIRRFELIKKLDTRKHIEKKYIEDYNWEELVDFVDTRIPYYQKTILGKEHHKDHHED